MSVEDAQAFWRRVNKRIKDLKMTQEDVAKKMGINYATFRTWSHVKAFPKVNDIFVIAQVLETTMNFLLFGTDTEPATTDEFLLGKRALALIDTIKDILEKEHKEK